MKQKITILIIFYFFSFLMKANEISNNILGHYSMSCGFNCGENLTLKRNEKFIYEGSGMLCNGYEVTRKIYGRYTLINNKLQLYPEQVENSEGNYGQKKKIEIKSYIEDNNSINESYYVIFLGFQVIDFLFSDYQYIAKVLLKLCRPTAKLNASCVFS